MIKWFSQVSYRTFYYRSVAALILGVIMLFMPNITLAVLVQLIGAFVLLAGVGTLIVAYRQPQNFLLSVGGVSAIVSIVFGAVLLFSSDIFINMVITLFGIMLLVVGLLQIINTANLHKEIKNANFYFAGGAIPLLVGLLFLCFPGFIEASIGVFLGITLIIYALNELGLGFRMRRHFNQSNIVVEDVAFEEVEEDK